MKLHLRLELGNATGKDDHEVVQLPADRIEDIGEAFYDAYVDTIDYEGEAVEDAVTEVKDVFAGAYGKIIPEVSGCFMSEGLVASAIFAVESTGGVFIPYVITTKRHSGRGYATRLIENATYQANRLGYRFIDLYVTKGNDAAERIYRRLGFIDAPPEEASH
jgi:GNAT superfamily N-acetyltransferase